MVDGHQDLVSDSHHCSFGATPSFESKIFVSQVGPFAAESLFSQKVPTSKQSRHTITCSADRLALPAFDNAAIFMHGGEPKDHGIFAQNDSEGLRMTANGLGMTPPPFR